MNIQNMENENSLKKIFLLNLKFKLKNNNNDIFN